MTPVPTLPAMIAAGTPGPTPKTGRWASPTGSSSASGTSADPVDLATAFSSSALYAGDKQLWLLPGTYAGQFTVTVPGLTVKPSGGLWTAAIDGSLTIGVGIADVTVADLEIRYTAWASRTSAQTGSIPTDVPTWASLTVYGPRAAVRCCLLHDLAGIGLWTQASPAVFEGNVVHSIGWTAPDRGHGHGIYSQGTGHRIGQNLFAKYYSDYSVHCYGTAAAVLADFTVRENVGGGILLVGGGQSVTGLTLERCHTAAGIQLGYAPFPTGNGGTGTVTDNVAAVVTLVGPWPGLVETGDRVFGTVNGAYVYPVAGAPTRALLVIHNAALAGTVRVNLSGFAAGRLVWWQDPSQSLDFSPGLVDVTTSGWGVAAPVAGSAATTATAPGFLAFLVIPNGE